MKEFIEKLIGRLEEYKYSHLIERDSGQTEHCLGQEDCEMMDCTLCVWDKAIEIVNQLAEEYNQTIDVADLVEKFGQKKVQSNAERIRAMSDEELAEFLKQTFWQAGANLFDCADYNCGLKCEECKAYLKWLQSEAE